MSVRSATAGKTRTCPHCRATILESAAVCPACRHHLRFDSRKGQDRVEGGEVALGIEGSFSHPAVGEPWEYSVVVVIRDGRGEEVARKMVGVGSLAPGEQRSVSLSVEVFKTSE
jgi:uncharacterized protein YbaR (Trm112 family)